MDPFVASAASPRQLAYPKVHAGELAVIGEMLASLDSLTHAGRHHVMAKIAAFMQARVAPVLAGRGPAERARIAELIDRVKHEAGRPLPVVPSFTDAVGRLVAVPGLFV
jgi:hypothetical protein